MITRDINKKTWLAIISDPAVMASAPKNSRQVIYDTRETTGILARIDAIPFLQFRVFESVLGCGEVDRDAVEVVRSLITGLPIDAWKQSYWWCFQAQPGNDQGRSMISRDQIEREERPHDAIDNRVTVTHRLSFGVSHSVDEGRCESDPEFGRYLNRRAYDSILEQIQPAEEFEQAFRDCLQECGDLMCQARSTIPAILKLKAKLDLREPPIIRCVDCGVETNLAVVGGNGTNFPAR